MDTSNTPKYNPEIYTKIALNDLVAFSVSYLSEKQNEISAEDIVAACFLLFPRRFSLRGYPQWPDSTVVNKRWIDCRNKKLITGSTAKGFSITPAGQYIAEKVLTTLCGTTSSEQKPHTLKSEARTRAGRFIKVMENSDAFKGYSDNPSQEISEFDFRGMLLCTMESSASTLLSNLEQFKSYAQLYERSDLLVFLSYCETRFSGILKANDQKRGFHLGGMLPKKK